MFDYLHIIRNSAIIYLFMLIAIRLLGKREFAQLSIIDLVFVLLISNAVQNAMVDPSAFQLEGGLVAASTLFLLNFLLNKLGYRFSWFEKLFSGEPHVLIYEGKVNETNLKKAQISINDLMESIREHGAASISEVNLAMLETDGNISILSNNFTIKTHHERKRRKKLILNS